MMYFNPKKLLEIQEAKERKIQEVRIEKQRLKEEKVRLRDLERKLKSKHTEILSKLEEEYEHELAKQKKRTQESPKDSLSYIISKEISGYTSEATYPTISESKASDYQSNNSLTPDPFYPKHRRLKHRSRNHLKSGRSNNLSPSFIINPDKMMVHLVGDSAYRSKSTTESKTKKNSLEFASANSYTPHRHVFRDIPICSPTIVQSQKVKKMLDYYKYRIKVDFKPMPSLNKAIELSKHHFQPKKCFSFKKVNINDL